MTLLDTATKTIEIRMLEASITTEADWILLDFRPHNVLVGRHKHAGSVEGTTNGTTDVVILDSTPAPAGLYQVGAIKVYNADTVVHTIEIVLDDGTNEFVLMRELVGANKTVTLLGDGSISNDSADVPALEHGGIRLDKGGGNQVTSVTPGTATKMTQFTGNSRNTALITPDHTADEITIEAGGAGRYWCQFDGCFIADAGGPELSIFLAVNGTSTDRLSGIVTQNTATRRAISGNGIMILDDGDLVSLNIASDTASQTIRFKTAHLNIVRISS